MTRAAILAALAFGAVAALPAVAPLPVEGRRSVTRARTVVRVRDGIPTRFVEPDGNKPIRCWVDADHLPAGLNLAQAMGAVSNALNAWTAVSSALFSIEGIASFGTGAENMTDRDGVLWIQLHNGYGTITNDTTLGLNGRFAYSDETGFPGGGLGGRMGAQEFNQTAWAFIAIAHTNAAVRNPTTLEEVLCHEVGHALGLDHSSETAGEANLVLKEAMMYFENHGDGRGAQLKAWDIAAVQTVHPLGDTPPCIVERAVEAVTSTPQPSGTLGVNEYEMPGFDRQGTPLTPILTNATANNGTFQIVGSRLRYAPKGKYSDGRGLFDYCYVRLSDGVNRSPPAFFSVIAFNLDNAHDGLPDTWQNRYWPKGNTSGGPAHDFDGDGVPNIHEWVAGTDPTNGASRLRLTEAQAGEIAWVAASNRVYQVHGAALMGARFAPAMAPVVTPTGGVTRIAVPDDASPRFFRLRLVL